MHRHPKEIAWAVLFAAAAAMLAPECSGAQELREGNIVGNPGFEHDWHNNQAEGHVLSFRGDYPYNSADLKPDYWAPQGQARWVEDVAHTGRHSLLLEGGASVARAFPLGITQSGGSSWSGPNTFPMQWDQPARTARTIHAALWYRARNLGEGRRLVLQVSFGEVTAEAATDANTDGWARLEAVLTREQIEAAYDRGAAKELARSEGFSVQIEGDAQVWIDDVSLAEDLAQDANLAANASFELVEGDDGYPASWDRPIKYVWRPPYYYKYTDWYHWYRDIRGTLRTCDLIAHSGQRSLMMQVLPGDEITVQGAAVALNQGPERGIIEIGAQVLLDRVKWIDIRAVDQDGRDVPCAVAYSGGWCAPPDTSQNFPSNARRWVYVRKWFQGEQPLKSIRPQLCARGFNGNTLDDMGTRPNCACTGVAWWDDVRVIERTATREELAARGVALPEPSAAQPQDVMIALLDPGDRLWGSSRLALTLANPGEDDAAVEVRLDVFPGDRLGLGDKPKPVSSSSAKVRVPGGGVAEAALSYTIGALDGAWDRQGRMRLAVASGGRVRTLDIPYNTWPVIVDVDFSKHYSTPVEDPQTVALNLGVADEMLSGTRSLVVEVRRRGDGSLVHTVEVQDLAAALAQTRANLPKTKEEGFEFDAPGPVFWADKRNLLALKMDFSALPVHPHDEPVRDHFLRVRGLDAEGNELFRDDSQFFGRVEQIQEDLPKIERTEVRQDGAVLVNGQPVFLMADGGYVTARYSLSPQLIKRYGFNARRWVQGIDEIAQAWHEHNLWVLEGMIWLKDMGEGELRQWAAEGKLDGCVTLAPYYEHSTFYDPPEDFERQKWYAEVVRKVANRISNFGGGGAHTYYTLERILPFYDSFGVELEPVGLPRGGFELASILRQGGKAWFHLPQTYDPEPFEMFRVDQYATVLQGGRGFSVIQGIGDPSLYRGITGEMRHLSPAIFSQDTGPAGTNVTPDVWWMQRRVGGTVTIIAASLPPVEVGSWTWRTDRVFSGRRAHSGVSSYKPMPTPDGLHVHGYRQDKPLLIREGDRLVQYVWLDPQSPPTTIAWGPRGDGRCDFNGRWGEPFDHEKWKREWINLWLAGELTAGTGEITAWSTKLFSESDSYAKLKEQDPAKAEEMRSYIEGIRDWSAQRILGPDAFVDMGKLPAAGQWVRLELDAARLGLVGKQVDGFVFIARNGEAWWDHTALLRDGQEVVPCEDTVGIPRDEVRAVRFSVPWAPDGTRVKVLFEDRELTVQDGAFVDDFTGVDTYGAIGDSLGADAEAGYDAEGRPIHGHGLSYSVPNAPTCVHAYEVLLPAK